jgi:hypothetical protein
MSGNDKAINAKKIYFCIFEITRSVLANNMKLKGTKNKSANILKGSDSPEVPIFLSGIFNKIKKVADSRIRGSEEISFIDLPKIFDKI